MPTVTVLDPCPQRACEIFRSTLGITDDRLNVRAESFTESYDVAELLSDKKP